jgi:hypothetical protein
MDIEFRTPIIQFRTPIIIQFRTPIISDDGDIEFRTPIIQFRTPIISDDGKYLRATCLKSGGAYILQGALRDVVILSRGAFSGCPENPS